MNEDSMAFTIDDDVKAEWALGKIREAQEERDRLLELVKQQKEILYKREQEICDRYEGDTNYLRYLLQQYMQTVKCKSSKTQDTYQLLSGKLVRKHAGYEIQRDDAALLRWLEDTGNLDLIQVKTAPKWGEIKRLLRADPETGIVTIADTGEFVDGLTAVQTPEAFDIKFEQENKK